MQMKRSILLDLHVSKDWYGLQLHVEIMPMWIVCLHLVIFCSEQVPRNSTLKSRYFRFFRKKKGPKLFETRKVRMCAVLIRMRTWSLSHSTKPWSCGMYSYCRDPKKRKNGVGDSLCADGHLVVKRIILTNFHVLQFKYGLQLNVERVPIWIACLNLEIYCPPTKVMGPSQSPLWAKRWWVFTFDFKSTCTEIGLSESH
jgi:hypothetical protein